MFSRSNVVGQAHSQSGKPSRIDAADDSRNLCHIRGIQVTQTNRGCLMQSTAGKVAIRRLDQLIPVFLFSVRFPGRQ
jgi:hypothetical protein